MTVEVYTRKKGDSLEENQCWSERWVNSYSTLSEFHREWVEEDDKEKATHFFFEKIGNGFFYRQGGCRTK